MQDQNSVPYTEEAKVAMDPILLSHMLISSNSMMLVEL